jgi:hypothetical protein
MRATRVDADDGGTDAKPGTERKVSTAIASGNGTLRCVKSWRPTQM